MNKQENFNDIIRSKFSERKLPFDEANWENIKKMTTAAREKRKYKRWAIIFFIGLFSGIGVMIPLFMKINHENRIAINKIKEQLLKKDENLTSPSLISPKGRRLYTQTELRSQPLVVLREGPDGLNSNESDKILTPENTTVESKKKIAPDVVDQKETKVKSSNSTDLINSSTTKKEESALIVSSAIVQNETTIKNKNSSFAVNSTVVGLTQNVTSSSPALRTYRDVLDTTRIVSTRTDKTPSSSPPEKIEQIQAIEVMSNGNNSVSVSENSKFIKDTVFNQPEIVQENIIQIAVDTMAKPNDLVFIHMLDTSQKKTDSTVTIKQNIADPLLPRNGCIVKKNIFFVETGPGFAMGWNYHDTTEGQGLNPVIGIGVIHILNPKWSFQTAVQGNTIGHLNESQHTIKHINNDFGYNSIDSIIATNWLYYVTVPVKIQYNLNKKNSIGVGGAVSYLINGSGKITIYNQSDDAGITNQKVTSQTGYVKGFNQWNASAMILYRRKFSNRFSASLIPYLGLMDIKNNSFFIRENFERDMGIEILFSYTIF